MVSHARKVEINMQSHWTLFAANYDCSAYGAGDYNSDTCATTGTDGNLSNTGTAVLPALVGGVLLVAVAIAILVRLIIKKKRSA